MSNRKEENEQLREQVEKAGVEAKALLNNPLLSSFFTKTADDCFNSFCNLPQDATLEDYRAIHHKAIHLHKFKRSLEIHTITLDDQRSDDMRLEAIKEAIKETLPDLEETKKTVKPNI